MNKRLALLLLALVSILALVACGSGGSDAEEEIDEAIITSITGTDPSKCTEVMTQRFLDQNADEDGQAALEECEEEAGDSSDDPDEVIVSEIQVDGSEASADVAFVGGNFDGQTLTVKLLEVGDQWKLDEIEAIAEYDAEALAQTFEGLFESSQLTPAQISCIGDAIRDTSTAEAEELLLSGDSSNLVELAETCE